MPSSRTLLTVTLAVGCLWLSSAPRPLRADNANPPSTPSVAVTGVPVDQDTTITVRKGERPLEPDYRIDSGSEEISGDPASGQQASYEAWKKACSDWKKDMREMNGKTLIALSCGTPHATRDKSSLVTQTSTGTYKVKVRIRDAQPAE